MAGPLEPRQLTGLDESHLVTLADGHRLHPRAAQAFAVLQEEAARAGFQLAIASSFRSCARQLAIFNGKAAGQRPIHDDAGKPVNIDVLSPRELLRAILRFSALPGTSRHHWGTDLDVYDASAAPADYQVQLSPAEVTPGGMFDALHNWLDERMACGDSQGFFRPYSEDRGGVAPERWHLSYAPLARDCAGLVRSEDLLQCWQGKLLDEPLLLLDEVTATLPELLERYVAVPQSWCSAPSGAQ